MAIVGLDRGDHKRLEVSFTEPVVSPGSSISVLEPKPKSLILAIKSSSSRRSEICPKTSLQENRKPAQDDRPDL